MKFSTIESKGRPYSFIYLETREDVEAYEHIDRQVKSKQSVKFILGYKTQTFYNSPSGYAAHQVESSNNIATIMALDLEFRAFAGESKVSLADYCTNTDKMLNEYYSSFYEWVNRGLIARININSGSCSVTPAEIIEAEAIEINQQQMYNWITSKSIDSDFEMKSRVVVLENNKTVQDSDWKMYANKIGCTVDEMQLLNHFKLRTILYSSDDMIRLFKRGILAGMETLAFSTSAEDKSQIWGIKRLLEGIMSKLPDKTLNVMINCPLYVKEEHKDTMFKTDLPNIKINFLR